MHGSETAMHATSTIEKPRASRAKPRKAAAPVEPRLDPASAAKAAKLRYVSDKSPGITRHRSGTTFSYRSPDGKPIRDKETLQRIKRLAIPPAWEEVWICPYENGHIEAVGRDARRRKQYRY